MKLEMRHWLVGDQPNGKPWPSTGGTVDLDDDTLVADLVARGAAVVAAPDPVEVTGDSGDEPGEAAPADLTAGSVSDVLARVGRDQVLAAAVLEQEEAKPKPRKGVVDALAEVLDEEGDCGA